MVLVLMLIVLALVMQEDMALVLMLIVLALALQEDGALEPIQQRPVLASVMQVAIVQKAVQRLLVQLLVM